MMSRSQPWPVHVPLVGNRLPRDFNETLSVASPSKNGRPRALSEPLERAYAILGVADIILPAQP